MPNALQHFARAHPALFAALVVIGVAGVTTMFLDYRGQRKRHTDEEILAARRREAIRKANQWYENESSEPRLHWWS